MRVLMTTDAVGGVWAHSLTLGQALGARGVAVRLAVLGPAPGAAQVAAAEAAGLPLVAYPCRLEWQDGGGADLAPSAAWLREQAEEHRADLVHSNQFAYGAYHLGRPVLVVGHSDILSWQAWCHPPGAPVWPPWAAFLEEYRAVVAAGLREATALAASSHFMADNLRAIYGIHPAHGIAVLPNGIHLPAAPPTPRPASSPLHVLAAGRVWDAAKNLGVLAQAVGVGLPGVEVAVAGPLVGPDGEGAEAVAGLRAATGITWLGALPPDAMAARMQTAHIFVGASRYEPFGLAPLEAAAAGCALLLADIPAFRELWGGVARFFPPDDAGALRGLLHEWAAHPAQVAEWAARAQGHAGQYTAARMAADYHHLYERIVATP